MSSKQKTAEIRSAIISYTLKNGPQVIIRNTESRTNTPENIAKSKHQNKCYTEKINS